ncbi:tape measure protein [Bacteroides fragilis]|uniref:tape measure protein n=1 Tax=Bacteroides fragilis TaxID=817 RepID=UPI0022AB282C|nr:tape measure protein [Bacteroides fragilis]MCZ2590800.1 tape measure protein [Bacteroides fragilis]
MAGLHFDITGDNSNFIRKLHECENGVKNTSRQIEQSGLGIEDLFNRMTKAAAAFGVGFTAKELISNIAHVRGEFQQLEVAFKTMLGSEDKANALMQQLVKTAATTPFDLQGVANGAKQLLAYGENVENVNDDLIRLGNIAAGLSQPLGDIVYLYGTTMTQGRLYTADLNQFTGRGIPMIRELAKVFGVAEGKVKGLVEAGKVGFPEVQKVIQNLTNEGGMFFNLMQEQSKTIAGQISNIEDAIATMFNEIGKANEGIINDALSGVSYLVENYEKVGALLLEIVGTYGVYRTALMATTALQALQASGITALTAKEAIHYGWLVLTKKAQDALNLSMLKNPYILVAASIAGLVYGIYKFATAESDTEQAIRKTNDALEAQNNHYEELKNRASQLSNILSDESKSIEERFIAYRKLQRLMPEVFKDMDWEAAKRKTNAELIKLETDELLRQQRIGLKTKVVMSQQKIQGLRSSLIKTQNAGGYTGALKEDLAAAEKELEIYQEALKAFEEAKEESKKAKNAPTVQDKEYWENQKKEAENALESIASSQKRLLDAGNFKGIDTAVVKSYKDNVKKLKEAEKELKVYDSSSKQESAAEKLRKQQEGIRSQNDKISEIERKQAIQRKRQAEDMEMEISQSEINAMTEGAEKKRMQRELDNWKEIQSLKRQKEDMIQAVIQAEKEIFDAQEELKAKENNKYQKKTFDSSKVDTGKISSIWDTIIGNTSKKQLDDKIREQEESWNEYLIKFGNYQQKRLAIIEKYDKAIKEAETAGDAAILMKEKANALDDFDNSVKNSTTLMGQLFADASQKSVNEIQTIIEKAELLMQYLAAVKDEQGNAQIGGKTVSKKDILGLGITDNTLQNLELSTEQTEALRNAIGRLKEELGAKSPFALFKKQVKEAAGEIAKGGKENIARGIAGIGSAIVQFTPAISQFGQDLGTIFGNDDLGNKIAGISDALGGVGQTAMGVGQIMSGDIVGGAMSAVSGISSVVKALDGLFGADYSRYNEMKSQYEVLNSVWDELINKKKEYIDMSYGDEAYKVGKEAETLIKQQTQRYYELLNELRQSGSSIGSSSLGKRIEKRLSKKDWDRISGAVGESVTNAESLLNLSAEQLKEVLADPKLVSVLNTVNEDFIKYIQDIVNGSEKLEDIQNQVKEQLTQVSFDSVFDSFVDTLMNMDSSAKDFADDFTSYMQKAILSTMLGKTYEKRLQEWYDAFASANEDKGGISSDEYKNLQEQWNSIVNDAIKERDELKDLLGWSSVTSASQDSTKRGFGTEMTHEDVGELSGRFTALQMAGEEIKNQMINVVVGVNSLISISTEGNVTLSNILSQHVITNGYLEDIVKHTKLMLGFGDKFDRMITVFNDRL